MPESFKKSFQTLFDSEWWRLETHARARWPARAAHRRLGRRRAGARLEPGAAHVHGRRSVRRHPLPATATTPSRRSRSSWSTSGWGATMVLTEPDAGSDVGAGRTKAIEQPDGSWHIEGVKRFITSAEHDLAENIVHLVLARPEGAGPGHQGAVAVRRAEVPLRRRDRRARRAQRRLRHQRRAQDGPQGLDHLRAALRREPGRPGARAGSSATCTTASRRCSRSSSTPG